jgi:hypothetical protein
MEGGTPKTSVDNHMSVFLGSYQDAASFQEYVCSLVNAIISHSKQPIAEPWKIRFLYSLKVGPWPILLSTVPALTPGSEQGARARRG